MSEVNDHEPDGSRVLAAWLILASYLGILALIGYLVGHA